MLQEAEGYLPERGLRSGTHLQKFEVFLNGALHRIWRTELARLRLLRSAEPPRPSPLLSELSIEWTPEFFLFMVFYYGTLMAPIGGLKGLHSPV